jgi:hypothetical protein
VQEYYFLRQWPIASRSHHLWDLEIKSSLLDKDLKMNKNLQNSDGRSLKMDGVQVGPRIDILSFQSKL